MPFTNTGRYSLFSPEELEQALSGVGQQTIQGLGLTSPGGMSPETTPSRQPEGPHTTFDPTTTRGLLEILGLIGSSVASGLTGKDYGLAFGEILARGRERESLERQRAQQRAAQQVNMMGKAMGWMTDFYKNLPEEKAKEFSNKLLEDMRGLGFQVPHWIPEAMSSKGSFEAFAGSYSYVSQHATDAEKRRIFQAKTPTDRDKLLAQWSFTHALKLQKAGQEIPPELVRTMDDKAIAQLGITPLKTPAQEAQRLEQTVLNELAKSDPLAASKAADEIRQGAPASQVLEKYAPGGLAAAPKTAEQRHRRQAELDVEAQQPSLTGKAKERAVLSRTAELAKQEAEGKRAPRLAPPGTYVDPVTDEEHPEIIYLEDAMEKKLLHLPKASPAERTQAAKGMVLSHNELAHRLIRDGTAQKDSNRFMTALQSHWERFKNDPERATQLDFLGRATPFATSGAYAAQTGTMRGGVRMAEMLTPTGILPGDTDLLKLTKIWSLDWVTRESAKQRGIPTGKLDEQMSRLERDIKALGGKVPSEADMTKPITELPRGGKTGRSFTPAEKKAAEAKAETNRQKLRDAVEKAQRLLGERPSVVGEY